MADPALAGREGIIVPAPLVAPLGFGLLSVAQGPSLADQSDEHWVQGIQWQEDGQGAASTAAGWQPATVPDSLLDVTFGAASSVACQVVIDVSAVGRDPEETFRLAGLHLDLAAPAALERAVWTGTASDGSPLDLAFDKATALGTGPYIPEQAVGILEAWLGTVYNGVGVIHAPRQAGAVLGRKSLISTVSGKKQTELGTLVAVGAGYTTDPLADPVTFVVPPAVAIRQSGDVVTPWIADPVSNRVLAAAQRIYTVAWEGPCASIQVQIGE